MVYKRYVKKRVDGKLKTFGPYYYESYRDKEGQTKTRYVSDSRKIGAVTRTNANGNFFSRKVHEFSKNNKLKLFLFFWIDCFYFDC